MPEFVISNDVNGNIYQVDTAEILPRPSAYAIVVHNDQLLLSFQFNRHMLPGGGLDPGETAEAGVIRETKEETGIDVGNPRHVSDGEKFATWEEKGKHRHVRILARFFACDYVSGEPSMDYLDGYEKTVCEMPRWVPLAELDTIERGGAIDWLPIVKKVLNKG